MTTQIWLSSVCTPTPLVLVGYAKLIFAVGFADVKNRETELAKFKALKTRKE